MAELLTTGDLNKLFTDRERNKNPLNGVYQIQNTKKVDPNTNMRKNIIIICDGLFHSKCLVRSEAANKFHSLNLQKGDIIRITAGEPHIIPAKMKFVLLVDDFEVVKSGAEIVDPTTQFIDTYFTEHKDELLPELLDPNAEIEETTTATTPPPPNTNTNTNINNDLEDSVPSKTNNESLSPPQQHESHQQIQNNDRLPSQNSQRSRPISAIEQLSPYQSVWTIKARVSYKGDIKTWHNQRGEGKLLNVNFLDTSGEIRATSFNTMADKFNEMLHEGKVYYISKARLQPSKPKFTNLSHPYELSMDKDTIIEECFDESNVPKTHFNFVKLDAIENQENNSTIDVLGIVQTVKPHFEMTSRAGKKFDRRDIDIVDDSNYAITVGLWNKAAIDFNLPEGSVVAIKGVRVSDFGGKSLSMGFSSVLMPNPEIPEAYALKGWYDTEGSDQKYNTLKQEMGAGSEPRSIEQRITIEKAINDNLGKSEKGDFFSIKAHITFLKVDNFAYPACSNTDCNKKVTEQSDGTWRCEKCETDNEKPNWRYILTISVTDSTGQLWLTLFNEQGERLLGIDASKLTELKNNDSDAFTTFTQQFQMKEFDFRIRAREDNYNDQSRIRYTVSNLYDINYGAEADYLAGELSKQLL